MIKDPRLDQVLKLLDEIFNDASMDLEDRLDQMELAENRAADNAICLEDEIAAREEREETYDNEESEDSETGGEN